MLSKWRKQVRDCEVVDDPDDPPPLEPQEAAELQRLREVEKQFRGASLQSRALENYFKPLK
jgi:hypothetical protein